MLVTKVFPSKSGNGILFAASEPIGFGLVQDALGYLRLADPSTAAQSLAEIEANLSKFSLGEKLDGSDFYKVVLS